MKKNKKALHFLFRTFFCQTFLRQVFAARTDPVVCNRLLMIGLVVFSSLVMHDSELPVIFSQMFFSLKFVNTTL